MFENNTSPYFTERARESWRTLGYGGLAIPFLWGLHMPGPIIAVAAAAFLFPSARNFVNSHRERNGDELPSSITLGGKGDDRRELGNTTFRGLMQKWRAELSLDDLVTEAANCSNEYNRRLCVIYLKVPGVPTVMREFVTTLLRQKLRGTDEVRMVSDSEFIVCAPLLRDALATDVVADRLAKVIQSLETPSGAVRAKLGKGIYPMDGYTGAELIAHAKTAAQAI